MTSWSYYKRAAITGQTSPSSTNAMKAGLSEERSVTPKKAIAILDKHGYQISEEEAIEILDFLYILAKLTVNQYLKGGSNEGGNHENS